MELPNARTKFPEVQQRGLEWCIPAGFEVLLHYFNIAAPTQEQMVLEYDRLFGDKGYAIFGRGLFLCTRRANLFDLQICGFPHGDFNSFTAIANSLLPPTAQRVFFHPADCNTKFEQYLADSVARGNGILGVARLPNGNCHVLPIVGFDNPNVTAYNPGDGNIETKPLADFAFNRDCVILQPK